MDIDDYDLYTAGTEGQDSRTTLDDVKHQNITMDWLYLQPEEDIYTAGDERPQPSAPLDIAKFIIKVDWTEPFPDRWRATLQKALQSSMLKLEGKPSVHRLKLMDDQSCAEVQITPSTALEALKKLRSIPLNFKHENKEVTAWICPDETQCMTASCQTSMLYENGMPSSKVIGSSAVSEDTNNIEDVAASNRAQNEAEATKTDQMTPETPAALTVPLHEFWYMHHAYRKELEQFEQQHGVSICAEVSVSIKHMQRSSHDSVSKTTDDFQKLVQGCVDRFSEADINHNHMDSEIVKQALHHIQSEETKMMFTMSSSNCLFFGPKKFTDVIKRGVEETRMKSQFNDKSSQMNEVNYSLDVDTKDLPTPLEMNKVHWDLMKLSYKEQILQLQAKYGVSFDEGILQKNGTIKVQARSKEVQHINLECHAIRALTQLYHKLASAAVTCELTNPADAAIVGSTVEKLQQLHCVVVEDGFSPWRLVGLPEHLGPAIAEIEKTLQKRVFDDKIKTLIGYSGDMIPMHDYGSGAVGGSVQDEGVNVKRRIEADSGFNKDSKDNSTHKSKAVNAEEETCAICMDSFTNKKKLKCGHEFCRDCISVAEKSLGSICPVCKEVYGILEGNQPDGTMNITTSSSSLPGYLMCGTIEITYNISDGVQTMKHPNPGKPFYGTTRHAYLPDNPEGREVLTLLQRAFHQKLIFTVGKSTTTGADNMVTWNDIPHKTNRYGGPERYGYPDPGYLKRVKDELKSKGIETETAGLDSQFKDKLQKSVFDGKMKKSIGYARGIKWILTPDYGPGAVGGSVQDEGMNFERRIEADSGFNKDSKESSKQSKDTHAEEETCAICMDSFTNKKKLKCGHEFCRDCISEAEKSLGSICPVCKEVYGILEGNQPDGTMKVTTSSSSLPGYPQYGTIEITYNIPSGVQMKKHPNPGKPFYGTTRHAYLPDNPEGREVLTLLQRAFHQKLIFTVGKSTTTGADNMVTWNDIPHKTNKSGGPERYGYPDPDYLKRVKDELKSKGIETETAGLDSQFKDKLMMKKATVYSRRIKWIPTPDYGSGAVGGSVQDEGMNFKRRIEADSGFNKDSKESSKQSKDAHAVEETCAICMDSFTNKKKLKCGHEFCRDCISAVEMILGSICPACNEVYGIFEGNQPDGTMNITKSRLSLPGYPICGTIEICYNIPSGVQTKKHPNPGKPFYGTTRHAYLPDNPEGREVLTLLQRAFHQKLIFTVGKSTTTGADNMVTWNDIPHKTNSSGGPKCNGYPDPDYLKRVKDQLKAKGIE